MRGMVSKRGDLNFFLGRVAETLHVEKQPFNKERGFWDLEIKPGKKVGIGPASRDVLCACGPTAARRAKSGQTASQMPKSCTWLPGFGLLGLPSPGGGR